MRPRGSTNGRVPAGGFPELSLDDTAFLSGFLEGEACFAIARQARGFGYRCVVTVNVRDDDDNLVRSLHGATRIGRLTSVGARRTSKPQTAWRIQAKADCLRLTELIDRAPLRGRKSVDYAIWRAAVNAWVGTDPTARRASRDWPDLAYLKGRLSELKSYDAARPPSYERTSGLGPDWLPYLAGFVTAEGHFAIAPSSDERLRPTMLLNVRADDRALLAELARRARAGRIYAYEKRAHARSPMAHWAVFSAGDLRQLVGLLDESPPRGRKGAEYEIWREAVAVLDLPQPRRQPRLSELRSHLQAARAYAPRS
jgi:hypothetical protein